MGYYLHQVPGRLRIRTPLFKGNEKKASEAKAMIESIHGVLSTAINPVTGSLVIHYDPNVVEPETLTSVLTRFGYFDKAKAITNEQYIQNAATQAGQWAWKAIFGAFADSALQGSPLAVLTLFL
ncbi:MAG: hypothetical protein N3G78_00755 [Desulfobacterota bacterium]|nr:hypothetical protein [Thermodesulfobacteriota bacterium]